MSAKELKSESGKELSMEKKRKVIERLSSIFSSMDTNGDGELTWQEFFHGWSQMESFEQDLHDFDLDADRLSQLFTVIDKNGDGTVEQGEFLDALWELQTAEYKWTLLRIEHNLSRNKSDNDQSNSSLQQQLRIAGRNKWIEVEVSGAF